MAQQSFYKLNASSVKLVSADSIGGYAVSVSTFFYALIAFFLGLTLGRYRAFRFQNRGEALLSQVVRSHFVPPDYHLLNHVTLPLKDGSTQVDHILISRFGVFVIETKDYKGWIFANPKQAMWTQVIFKSKFRFQNPIFQNLRHVRAVQDCLDFLPSEAIRSVVVFTGDAEFKTAVPQGVFNLSALVEHIRAETTEVMSLNRLQFCVGRLETARLAISRKTDVEHVESLVRRHGGSA